MEQDSTTKDLKKQKILQKIESLKADGREMAEKLIKNNMMCKTDTTLDFYEKLGVLGPEETSVKNKDKDEGFNNILNFMFKHFRANPSDGIRSREIVDTYIKEGNISRSLRRYACANQDGISPKFWERITCSINKYKKHDPNAARDYLFTWLVGYKGCGKTTFINYFMSTKEEELNSIYKAITVRLNTAYEPKDMELQHSIKFKICKILFNYYCKDSEKSVKTRAFFSLQDILDNTILEKSELENFYHAFTGENNTKNSTKLIKEFSYQFNIFFKFIKNNHGYSFIIILDNIDQLGVRPDDKDSYKLRLEQLGQLMEEDDQVWGIYIFVMRPQTCFDVKKRAQVSPETFSIQIPSFSLIYHSRKKYLINNKKSFFKDKDEMEKYLDTYVQVVGSSLRSKSKYLNLLSLDDALKNIEQFCTFNKRQAINLMRLYGDSCLKDISLIDYLSTVISKENQEKDLSELLQFGYYRFFEALMLHTGYCCRFNGYDISPKNNELIFSEKSEAPNEYRFLPNLFKFPSKVNWRNYYSVFVKIRILQYLSNLSSLEESSIEEIKKDLNSIFDYNKNVINLACQVLIDGCCLESSNDFSNRFDNYPESDNGIKITDRGKIILQTFPEKLNYLSICFEDMPLPKEFMVKDEKITFPISNYYSNKNGICTFLLDNILYSSPIIIGMLEVIEKMENDKFASKQKQLKRNNKENLFKQDDFELIKRLNESANATYQKIIDTYVLKSEERYNYYFNLPYSC